MPYAAAIPRDRKGSAAPQGAASSLLAAGPAWSPHPAPHVPALVPLPAHAPRALVLIKHPGCKTGHLPEVGDPSHWMNSILSAKLHFGLWCSQTPALGSTGTCLHLHGGFGKQNKINLIHLLHLNHSFWLNTLAELTKVHTLPWNRSTVCGLKPYFVQCENPLTALSVPLITVISFCCAVFLHFSLSTNGDTCKIHASGQQSPCTLCPAQHLAFDRKLLPFPLLLWDTRGSGGVCDPTPTPPLLPAWDFSALTRLFSQPNNGGKKIYLNVF